MMSIEKLQKFIDDLRLGCYDNINYKFTAYSADHLQIKYISTGVSIDLQVSTNMEAGPEFEKAVEKYYNKPAIFRRWNWVKFPDWDKYSHTPSYSVYVDYQRMEVPESLYQSAKAYLAEQYEKDKLIAKSNKESAFSL